MPRFYTRFASRSRYYPRGGGYNRSIRHRSGRFAVRYRASRTIGQRSGFRTRFRSTRPINSRIAGPNIWQALGALSEAARLATTGQRMAYHLSGIPTSAQLMRSSSRTSLPLPNQPGTSGYPEAIPTTGFAHPGPLRDRHTGTTLPESTTSTMSLQVPSKSNASNSTTQHKQESTCGQCQLQQ